MKEKTPKTTKSPKNKSKTPEKTATTKEKSKKDKSPDVIAISDSITTTGDYLPSKDASSYHPINDACWKKGEK